MLFRLLFHLLAIQTASALTADELQSFINDAVKSEKGSEVVIPPGRHVLDHSLVINSAKKLHIAGLDAEQTILQLPPLAFAELSEPAKAGDVLLRVKRHQSFKPGMRLHLEADGAVDTFTQKPKPYHLATMAKIEGNTLHLVKPLDFPAPAGTLIRDPDAANVFEIRGPTSEVRISKLTLDGGRVAGDPPVRGHVQLCGILAQGPYSYEKGPTGPLIKNLHIERCFIQNCHGRGIALYACEEALIENCTIRDTSDEAIDFDHFTTSSIARHNHIARSLVGVELNDATACLVEQNDFLACQTGINLWRWCKQPGLNETNVISGNQFEQTRGNAIQIASGTAKNTVTSNVITASGKNGIILSGEKQVVKGNTISGSTLKDIAVQAGTHDIAP
jgi:hypothetical protein